uniref:Uncharacterized protein n=1 Tax=Suricata suricatta TaxID=37032 RepID=A0A673U3W9_SURSU
MATGSAIFPLSFLPLSSSPASTERGHKLPLATYASIQTEDWSQFMHIKGFPKTTIIKKSNLPCHLLTCACRTVVPALNL